jgi:5'-nucleotidase
MKKRPNENDRAWQRMLSGRRLDLLDPSPLDIEIADIAHGLARVARWNGQTSGAHIFSVAQHTLLVECVLREQMPRVDARFRLAALLHDAPEYVIGDMISPFKSVMGGSYKDCELRLQRAIHLRFSLPAELGAGLRKEIKRADQIAAYYEATLLAGFSTAEATEYFGRPRGFNAERFDFTPRSVTWAQAAFLKRFGAIEAKRQAAVTVHSAD